MKLFEFDVPSMKQLAKQVATHKATHVANQKKKIQVSPPEDSSLTYKGKNLLVDERMPYAWELDNGTIVKAPKETILDPKAKRQWLIARMYDTPLYR